jgi:glucose-1-phosphate cytidylyltransferase
VQHYDVPVFIRAAVSAHVLARKLRFAQSPWCQWDPSILWHIMRSYAYHGFRRLIFCLGYKVEVIKSYFLNYPTMNSDFTIEKINDVEVHKINLWHITW